MKLTLAVSVFALAAMCALAQAQPGNRPQSAPKLSKAEIQKVVQMISGDKTKTQQYCEIGKLNRQMEQADQKNDTKALETLGKQADDLAHKIGPDFVKFMDALDQVEDPAKADKDLTGAVETLDKLCPAQ
jgi:hypothetical protein